MKKWLQQLGEILSSAFPSAASPYWRALPLRRMKSLLTGVFFTTAVVGFAGDLVQLNVPALGRGLFWPAVFGAGAVVALVVSIKRVHSILRVLLILIIFFWIAGGLAGLGWLGWGWFTYMISVLVTPWLMPQAMKARIVFDAIGITISGGLGFRLLLSFVTHEGLANVRMQTELALAHGIQTRLVPDISLQTPRFEVYGKSISSAEMGGDLIDIIESEGSLLAYVADISGHGLAAGQLMGMLKTALRVCLQLHQQPVALLESADRVLPAVKEPDMYATLALLHFDASEQAEYGAAGHLPILHYRHRSGDTTRLSMEQFPLGLIPGGRYATQRVSYSPGDIFLLLTDGITEVTNDRGEEFGLARLEQLLSQHAGKPLSQIWELVMVEVKQHGTQQDDQSLMLLRVKNESAL
jgi:serine phosphatase RsbU (regulator of sigma subunit)